MTWDTTPVLGLADWTTPAPLSIDHGLVVCKLLEKLFNCRDLGTSSTHIRGSTSVWFSYQYVHGKVLEHHVE